jgi:hypothetical protein
VPKLRFAAKTVKCCAPARSPSIELGRECISEDALIPGLFKFVHSLTFDIWVINKMNDIRNIYRSCFMVGYSGISLVLSQTKNSNIDSFLWITTLDVDIRSEKASTEATLA